MPKLPIQNSSMHARDVLILQHIARHRLTTCAVLHRVLFKDLKRNAVVKILLRLCRENLLQRFPLIYPEVYFTLTAKACQLLGGVSTRSLPLGPQSLPSELAALYYCVCGPRYHKRLSRHEVQQMFPWFPKPSNHEIYSVDSSINEGSVLEWIRADLGGPSHHIVRKTHRRLQAIVDSEDAMAALNRQEFKVAFLTATAEKAGSIQRAIEPHEWPASTQIHLAIIPELVPLTTRYNHGT